MLKKAFKCWKNHQLAIHLHCLGFSSRLCNSEASTSLTRSGQAQVVANNWSPSSRARLKSISFETAEWLRLTSGWSNFESNATLCPIHCAMCGRRCAVLLTILTPFLLFKLWNRNIFWFGLSTLECWNQKITSFQTCNFTIHFTTNDLSIDFSLASHQLAEQTNVLQKHLKSHGVPQPKPNHNRTLVDWHRFLDRTVDCNPTLQISNKPSIGPSITATSRGASKKCNAWFLQSFVQLAQFY